MVSFGGVFGRQIGCADITWLHLRNSLEVETVKSNRFRVAGTVAYVALTDRAGKTVAEAIVDADDVARALEFGRWRRLGSGYVATSKFENGKRREVYLHRFLADAPTGVVVDHINGDPLDNRKDNLRVVRHSENMQNQRRLRADSTTGVRNVSYATMEGTYKVVIRGKFFGRYPTVEEAARVASANRQKVMPFVTV
jgi:hypothetical protein